VLHPQSPVLQGTDAKVPARTPAVVPAPASLVPTSRLRGRLVMSMPRPLQSSCPFAISVEPALIHPRLLHYHVVGIAMAVSTPRAFPLLLSFETRTIPTVTTPGSNWFPCPAIIRLCLIALPAANRVPKPRCPPRCLAEDHIVHLPVTALRHEVLAILRPPKLILRHRKSPP
jgi:hypothetical protein